MNLYGRWKIFSVFHCALTVFIQLFYMRDLEKFLGWARIALLYLGAGVGGYLASAIFVPYKVCLSTSVINRLFCICGDVTDYKNS